MANRRPIVIFGGGIAGLWLLDEAARADRDAILLEANALGCGQTIWSQGIIHGGLKYTLSGALTRSAESIRDLPDLWRRCLLGHAAPDLSDARLRAEHCHLWRTDSLRSRAGMIGAQMGLRVKPSTLDPNERPAPLRDCPGQVARLDEQVICPGSVLQALARRHAERILRIDAVEGLAFDLTDDGDVAAIHLNEPERAETLTLRPSHVVLTAGAGNGPLRERLGRSTDAMQIRPLRMVLLRGALPDLNGHCVDGARTRVTITTVRTADDQAVWQIGGQVAEDGAAMSEKELIAHARRELLACLPGLDLTGSAWATYRADRAEGRTPSGRRPDDPVVRTEGNVHTAWPSKLVLAPRLAETLLARLAADAPGDEHKAEPEPIEGRDWARPVVAAPPWETAERWTPDAELQTPASN